ncbi:serine protein kinase RIO [Candidatus Woesearchaeota archaeon]|nr:serine protein kinase RIO [Candidatus Woesearchaeota archaeon]
MSRMATKHKEAWKTFAQVFDRFTELAIHKLISKGVIDGLMGHASIGKEANVFLAQAKDRTVIVKIYRLSTCDFTRMYTFIRTDPRFPKLNRQRRKVVFAWAQREFRNLMKAREAGVRVPTPITHINNILVMDLVGDAMPAAKAKDQLPQKPDAFIADIIGQMRKLYKAGLVHGDLSPYNILNQHEKPVIIDMSQSTTPEDPNAKEFLERDAKNIAAFAKKIGVEVTADEILQKVKA